jgi:hypothetical protein
MTGTTIRTALNARLSKTEAVNAIDAQITLALQAIAARERWPDLHKTDSTTLAFTVGLKSKALPSDFQIKDRLYRLDDSTLTPMDPDTLRAYQEVENAVKGEPTEYAIIGGSVYLNPIPDASYTIYLDYWYTPATVTDETLALILGDEFQEAVICGTIVAYLKATGFNEHPKLAENLAMFDREIALLSGLADWKPTIASPYNYA